MNISVQEIKRQYERTVRSGWLAYFRTAARTSGFTVAHLLALGSRETNLKNIRGDFRGGVYHGYGVLQVDIGTDPEYARGWTPTNVERGIQKGAAILAGKLAQVYDGQQHRLTVRGRAFTGKPVDDEDARRTATAAYNCGLWAYYHFSRGENVDSTTTGDDYSRDVYDRAVEFAALLTADGTEVGALQREVKLQGKYARREARERAGLDRTQERLQLEHGAPMATQDETAQAAFHRDEQEPESNTSGAEVTDVKTNGTERGNGAGAGNTAAPVPAEPSVTVMSAPATTIETVQRVAQSWQSKATAWWPMVSAPVLAGWAAFRGLPPWAQVAMLAVGFAVGAWLWNESKRRQAAEQHKLIEAAASTEKNTVVIAPPPAKAG